MRILTILTTLLFLSGCPSFTATRSLSGLQTEFGTIIQTQDDCKRANGATEECMVDFKTMHTDIEKQSVAAIDEIKDSADPGDQQVTVGLYRLAAFASLRADTNKASDYGDAGSQLCESLDTKAPPRDCALLGVIGQYEVIEALDRDVDCFLNDDCDSDKTAEALANGYCGDYNKLATKTKSALQWPLLPQSVKTYLKRQIVEAEKPIQKLAQKLAPENIADQPEEPCSCVAMDSTDPDFRVSCGNVDASQQMATFKSMCIVESLDDDDDELDCPTF